MFTLKPEPNRDGSRLIYLIFNYKANRFKLSTGISIHPDQWDTKRERPKRSFRYYSQVTALLDRYEKVLHESYYDLLLTCIPTKETLRAEINRRLRPEQIMTVAQYAAEYADKKQGVAEGTVRQFRLVAGWIEKFDPKLTFEQIDLGVMLDFRDYLYSQKLESNTVASLFKRFKTILNAATESGVNTNLKYRNSKAVAKTAETTAIFLSEDELDRIRLTILPEWLEKYRDILLVSCYTGTRFQDIFKINRSAFVDNGQYFRITDKKENALAQIPCHPVVLAIMNRYEWELPKVSNPKFNENIKEVGRIAKIDQNIVITKYPGNTRVDTVKPKYKMITAHTGRRSLICNMIIAGVNRETIKSISGHRTDSSLNKYIRLTPSDHLAVAFKSSFFKASLRVL